MILPNKVYSLDPFPKINNYKNLFFINQINFLTKHHYKNSRNYKKILNFLKYNLRKNKLEDIPFLPVNLFKTHKMISVNKKNVFKTLFSSGTSGNDRSKIYLDKNNAINQVKALSSIMKSILGPKRLPMLIIDQKPNLDNRNQFNARVAAINGFSVFGNNHTYLLNENFEIDYENLKYFMKNYSSKKFFIFGFTSYIFDNLINKLIMKKNNYNFKNGILLHGGGWKKMEKKKISNEKFKKDLKEKFNFTKIYNYYGLVEQTGSIFIECKECSYFKTSIFSDILIRDKHFNVSKPNTKGLIQLFSLLPSSYPGHSILTEDIGQIIEKNDCKACSNLQGKNFKVYGRVKKSEIRGCSDVD